MNVLFGLCAAAAVLLAGGAIRPTMRSRHVAPVDVRPLRRWLRSCLAGGAVAVAVVAAGPVLAAAGICAVMMWRRWRAVRGRARRRRRIDATYPDVLDLVVLAVRSGFLPAAALEATTPHLSGELCAAFGAVTARVADGERFADALAALDELGPIARPLIDTFAAADRYGLALAPVLERLAFDARQQRRRAADALARQLPVRLSLPLVLCTLPSFVLLAIVPLLLGAFSSLHTP